MKPSFEMQQAGERDRRGSNLVELALIMPLLLLLLAAIADFGRAFNSYIVIHNAAREGARLAARVYHTANIDDYLFAAVVTEATSSGIGLVTCSGHGLPTDVANCADEAVNAAIAIDPILGSRQQNQPITVTVQYTMPTIFVGIVGLDEIPMVSRSVMVMYGEQELD